MVFPRLAAQLARLLNQCLRRQLDYVLEENRVYRAVLGRTKHRPHLKDKERRALALKARSLGRLLKGLVTIAKPDTLLRWHRELVAKKAPAKTDPPQSPGRPPISDEIEKLILRLARENTGWGYDRLVGALNNLGHEVSDQTVANVLARHGLVPAPDRRKRATWKKFLRAHLATLWATDFFAVPCWTRRGLATVHVLFFLHLQTRRLVFAGCFAKPDAAWIETVTRKALQHSAALRRAKIKPLPLPPRSPNLNAHAERFVRSVKEECLDHLIFFGEASLRRALQAYAGHYHHERNHQGSSVRHRS